jgi:hypothetical protein
MVKINLIFYNSKNGVAERQTAIDISENFKKTFPYFLSRIMPVNSGKYIFLIEKNRKQSFSSII